MPDEDRIAAALRAIQDFDSVTAASRDGTPLRDLSRLADVAALLEGQIRDQVVICRAQGFSWAFIGAALHITKQAAQQRFGDRAPVS